MLARSPWCPLPHGTLAARLQKHACDGDLAGDPVGDFLDADERVLQFAHDAARLGHEGPPDGRRLDLRVVRLNRATPSADSSLSMRRDNVDCDRCRLSEAARKLEKSATDKKARRCSSGWYGRAAEDE